MRIEEVSKYKDNVIAGKGKVVFIAILDYFAYFVGTMLIFFLGLNISIALPVTKNSITKYNYFYSLL